MNLNAVGKFPQPPVLTTGHKIVQILLRDLEKARKCTSKPEKLLARCEDLIFFVVSEMRKSLGDHLLQTTTVWVLINILRLEPILTRQIMITNGVPGILYEILNR